MPGSLLSINRKVKRNDSTRSDISTYSNDSKKKVSFNKAVRVKKYTKSEDGEKNLEGKKFWFKVYKDVDPDVWEVYSGDDEKYNSEDKLKTIDESSIVNHVDEPTKKNNVQNLIEKFNEEALNREDDGAIYNDTLTKQKKNYILNGMKAIFNSASLRSKKKNGSVKDRNLENLFLNESYDTALKPRNDKIDRILEEWSPEDYEGNLRNVGEYRKPQDRKSNSVVDVRKWESGDQLIFDTRQCEKSVDKTDKGELTRTVEERDQVWKNITRSITYAESSPKIIRKRQEPAMNHDKKINHSYNSSSRKDRTTQYGKATSEPIIKRSDKYKVIRSKNGVVSAYSNVPLLDKEKSQMNKTSSPNLNSICRPSICSRDHERNSNRNVKKDGVAPKFKQENRPPKKTSSRESSPLYKSDNSDYRKGYSTLRTSRRESRNRAKPRDNAPSINNVRITVNGEDIDNQSIRGGLATAFNNRQKARNLSASPLRSGSGSDTESTHQHKTVFLYIPGISHQQRRADDEEESVATLKKSHSIKGKRPLKYRYYGSKLKDQTDFGSTEELTDNRRFT